ncbi:Aste57867_7508 [Aphanomyces stellatus]|uniref:Aste57867_7508 protein n=1 Tax=Aphanomyces stellatus TaxID=120398 RepID=A0A485KIE4_9STRA|nr:hypothetical protein As57867_007482 [Aphanomyces stellatus]VFT84417.1 Aste57867_7508 [Aphanomyces stellatus]
MKAHSVAPSSTHDQGKGLLAPTAATILLSSFGKYATIALGGFCASLVAVDIIGNNWEFNKFVGDAKHFFTPLLNINTTDDLISKFNFPAASSPLSASNVGRWMVQTVVDQVHHDNHLYHLTMSQHLIQDPTNDVCGALAKTYIVTNAIVGSVVHLGTVQDQITFIRGNTLTHLFGSTKTDPQASAGDNATTLTAMGYVPGRVGLDMHLTTSVQVPPPGQSIAANVTMYTFYAKAFCSGCNPGTELGMDTCAVVYSYNDTTNALVVRSSQAIYGMYHVLGFTFQKRLGAGLSIGIRILCLTFAVVTFGASQKTVRWTDPLSLDSWNKRLLHLLIPPIYRHSNHALQFLYFYFNSDLIVLFYSAAILMDEDIAMVYARVMHRWAKPAGFNIWTNLRLWALGLRWLWFNLALLKLLKYLLHFVVATRYSGANKVMGLLNFSQIPYVYLTVCVLMARTDYIEHGNSVRVDLTSATQDLDTVYVVFGDSWYIRALPSLLALMFANLVAVLAIDRFVSRRWWRIVAKNTLGRQFLFNSTSILSDLQLPMDDGGVYSTATVKARTLCTLHWFFTSHLTCFGLPEDPALIRKLTSSKVATSRTSHSKGQSKMKPKVESTSVVPFAEVASMLLAIPEADLEEVKLQSNGPTQGTAPVETIHLLVQDDEGHMHLFDSAKREVQSLSVEVKILNDSIFRIA